MDVNRKRFIYIALSVLCLAIIAGFFIFGCSLITSLFTSSISGVLSVPITGEQHYETGDSFGSDFANAWEISYDDTAYGIIGTTDDVDFFVFTGSDGDLVIIDIDAEAFGSGLDSVLTLYDSGYNEKESNDDYPIDWQDDPANYIFVYDSHIEYELTSSGTYYIKVESFYGSSSGSYQLRLFQYSSEGSSSEAGDSSSSVEFVPEQIIVKYRPGYDSGIVKGMTQESGYTVLKSNSDTVNGALELLKITKTGKSSLSAESINEMTLAEVRRLNMLPYIEYAEPNYIMKPLFIPNDSYYNLQWHYPIIKLDMVWDEELINDVSSVRVAVIDTGIARSSGINHPDLGNFVDEYDFISDPLNSLDGDGIDSDATDPGDDPNKQFSSFHGTHVIGTIGALTNNTTGIAGVAGGESSGVEIMPLRALGARGGNVYDIAQALRYAAGLSNDSGEFPSKRADIINMSLGAAADSQTMRDAVTAAHNAGSLIIASAGNEGTSTAFYPAAYSNTISVSAVGPGCELAPYSSFGGTVDITAPGGDTSTDLTFDGYPDGVLSTLFEQYGSTYTPNYAFYQGTSMAAPHVSGVAALVVAALRERAVSFDANDIRDYMINNAIDLGQPGKDIYYGHGLINAYAAVTDALDSSQSPVLYPFPRTVKLEGSDPTGSFTLKNIAEDGSITVDSIVVSNDPKGLVSSIIPDGTTYFPVGTEGVDISVTLSTSGLEDGKTYYARLEITYDTSQTEYVYILYNRDGIIGADEIEDIGNVFVIAIDADTFETVAQDITTYGQSYVYTITDLPAGSYIIAAGTDRDSDLGISDAGEAWGFYPVYGIWVAIDVKQGTNLTGVDFQLLEDASTGPDTFSFTRK